MSPSREELKLKLKQLTNKWGGVTLTLTDGYEFGPDSVQVLCNRSYFLFSYLRHLSDTDEEVFSFHTENRDLDAKINILGDFWPREMVKINFSEIEPLILEFHETGTLMKHVESGYLT